jgi:large subunit ribosomal protein L13
MIAHQPSTWKIVDANGKILGRLLSQISKLLLLGEHIVIINAKGAVISGRRNQILRLYTHLREIGDNCNPTHGPFHPSRPDLFLRQRVHAMMPKNPRGKAALKRCHVYISGIPAVKEALYAKSEPLTFERCDSSQLAHKFVTVMDICDNMGWTRTGRKFPFTELK